MKFLIAFALIAVASAAIIKPVDITAGELGEINEIIAAINHPSTDPATASLLQEMLLQTLGIHPESPISVEPVIVQEEQSPISTLPVIVDFPLPDGGAVSAGVEPSPAIVSPSPAIVAPVAPADEATPLVQIILNINAQATGAEVAPTPAIVPSPAAVPSPAVVPSPVLVVEEAALIPEPVMVVEHPGSPVLVVEQPSSPVLVAEPVQPVQVAEPVQPVLVAEPVEPVLVANPVLVPAPVVPAPVILN